jgi:GDP-L-fucose synthase
MRDSNILVTGYNSMIGKATVEELVKNHYMATHLPRGAFDLTDSYVSGINLSKKVDCIIHLAGHNGGLAYNASHPSVIYNRTVQMGLNVINLAVNNNIAKIIFIVPSCALEPSENEVDENSLFTGRPHPSVECHGMAKRAVVEAGRQWEKQFGGKFITVICQNSFGPYDNFKESGKVVSGLISKFVNAKEHNLESVSIWGNGSPLREFIYCKDVGKGLVNVLEHYDSSEPIILNSGYEISIRDLALKIKEMVGYNGKLTFDTSKPNGQLRKSMSTKKTRELLKLEITDFDVALKETIDWYIESRKNEQRISNS